MDIECYSTEAFSSKIFSQIHLVHPTRKQPRLKASKRVTNFEATAKPKKKDLKNFFLDHEEKIFLFDNFWCQIVDSFGQKLEEAET